jgi:hypothetical protein
MRTAGWAFLGLQGALIALFIYGIIDSYVTPYTSEWLTADAFVPFYILGMLFLGLCMFLTWHLLRRTARRG